LESPLGGWLHLVVAAVVVAVVVTVVVAPTTPHRQLLTFCHVSWKKTVLFARRSLWFVL